MYIYDHRSYFGTSVTTTNEEAYAFGKHLLGAMEELTAIGVVLYSLVQTACAIIDMIKEARAGAIEGAGKTLNSVDDIVKNPQSIYGKSKADVSKILGDGWTEKTYGSCKTGWEFYKGDQRITYHPGGGIHKGSYYSYSSGATGRIKIVGQDYVPFPSEKATIIYGGVEKWNL